MSATPTARATRSVRGVRARGEMAVASDGPPFATAPPRPCVDATASPIGTIAFERHEATPPRSPASARSARRKGAIVGRSVLLGRCARASFRPRRPALPTCRGSAGSSLRRAPRRAASTGSSRAARRVASPRVSISARRRGPECPTPARPPAPDRSGAPSPVPNASRPKTTSGRTVSRAAALG